MFQAYDNIHDISVGADPEFFLVKGGTPISAHGIVPGDKKKPFKVHSGAVQLDGTAVEFNINPSYTRVQFSRNIKRVLTETRKIVDNTDKSLGFLFKPYVEYDKKYFETIPDQHKELGCDPDINLYGNNAPPKQVGTIRTGAGHIHIGWTKDQDVNDAGHIWTCKELVRALDNFFKYTERLWSEEKEEKVRRQMYGKLGSFRIKPYGVEYRALSNSWVKYPDLYPWLFDSVVSIFNLLVENKSLPEFYGEYFGKRKDYKYINAALRSKGFREFNKKEYLSNGF